VTATRVVIEGRVQGVGYRAWVEREAQRRGLKGWVRNRSDGTVEAVFSGTNAAVGEMIEACGQGPRMAAVRHLTRHDAAEEGWPDFSVQRTL
jgi:acylphosphatase